MTNMLIEAVVMAFCMGGAIGTIVTMHFQRVSAHNSSKNSEFDDPELKRVEVRVQTRRIK